MGEGTRHGVPPTATRRVVGPRNNRPKLVPLRTGPLVSRPSLPCPTEEGVPRHRAHDRERVSVLKVTC